MESRDSSPVIAVSAKISSTSGVALQELKTADLLAKQAKQIERLERELEAVKQILAGNDGPLPKTATSKEEAEVDDDSDENDEVVSLEESSWVFPLLLGVPGLSWATAIFLSLILLCTFASEIMFVWLLSSPDVGAASKLEETTVEGLLKWRRTVAHDYKYYNALDQATLVARVCNGDPALEMSGSQAQLYADLVSYLGESGDGTMARGQAMAALCVLAWTLTNLQELAACYLTCVAVCCLPRGRSTLAVRKGANCALSFKQLSRTHLWCFMVVQLGRAAIDISLCYWGILFLVYTPNMTELLLNVTALEFISSVDELMFAALAPFKVRALVAGAEPLTVKAPARWISHGCGGSLDLRAVFKAIVAAAIVLSAMVAELSPQISIMVRARDALCTGDTEFVYTQDGLGVVAWAYPPNVNTAETNALNFPDGKPPEKGYEGIRTNTRSFTTSVIDVLLRQQGRAIFQDNCSEAVCYNTSVTNYLQNIVGLREDCCHAKKVRSPQTEAGLFSLAIKAAETTRDASKIWNPSCTDVFGRGLGYDTQLQGTMGDAIRQGESSACEDANGLGCPAERPICKDGECITAVCSDLKMYCHKSSVAGVRARQLCSSTCGCDAPRYPLALSLPDSGCGSNCVESGKYLEARAALPCADVDKADPDFVAFLDDWYQVGLSWPGDWQQGSIDYIRALRRDGCAYLGNESTITNAVSQHGAYPSNLHSVNLCVENGFWMPIKPLSYYCPVACGCRSGDAHCPDACPARTADTPLCPDYQRSESANPFPATDADSLRFCPMTDQRNWGAKTSS